MSERTADYTIKGFLYQFHKTLLEVLTASDDDQIHVEGVIEDIEVRSASGIKAIQCKYHEAKENFTISAIYKPLLQMMDHFHNNKNDSISYVLYAYFPNLDAAYQVTEAEIELALATTDRGLQKYCTRLRGAINVGAFLRSFQLQSGLEYSELVRDVHAALVNTGWAAADIPNLAYPNAIHAIASLSILHDATKRVITRAALLGDLHRIKTTAISRWTLALKSKHEILLARRSQLKAHLNLNARRRYVLLTEALEDFDTAIVGFISDFLAKYHVKATHTYTPVFCLDTSIEKFWEIQGRLHRMNIHSTSGYVGNEFDQVWFFRDPMSRRVTNPAERRREFDVRILHWSSNGHIMAQQKPADLFVVGKIDLGTLDTEDVCVEVLESSTVKEVSFLTGVSLTYD